MRAETYETASRSTHEQDRPRLLVVDDEPGFVSAMRRRLRDHYVVHGAHGAAEALRVVENEGAFAVAISDLRMPGVDGIDLFSILRDRTPATTRILLTGAADATIAADAVNRGNVFRFLHKPCDDAALGSAIADGVAEHRRRDEHERLASHMVSCFQHEFRTPLHHIIGFASFLENGGSPAGAIREYARYIRESGESLVAMTDTLLTLAALREGRRSLDATDVKVRSVFTALRSRHRQEAADRRQQLDFRAEPGDVFISVDVRLMTMALSALVSNAIKFAPIGGEIEVVCRRDRDRVTLEVRDTGPGVEPALIDLVLRPFAQADLGVARKSEGIGLGLPLAKAAAELHGGALMLERAPDKRFVARVVVPSGLGHEDGLTAGVAGEAAPLRQCA